MNKLNSERLVLNLSPYHKKLLKELSKKKSLSMNAYVMYLLMIEEDKLKKQRQKKNDK